MTETTLHPEIDTFRAKLHELGSDEGKFALVRGDQVVGVFVAYEDAIKEGYEKFGLTRFMVKQIHAFEPIQFVSRLA